MEVYWTGEAILLVKQISGIFDKIPRLMVFLNEFKKIEVVGFSFFNKIELSFVAAYYKFYINKYNVVFSHNVWRFISLIFKDIIRKKIQDPYTPEECELCHHIALVTGINYSSIMSIISIIKHITYGLKNQSLIPDKIIFLLLEAESVTFDDIKDFDRNKFYKYFESRKLIYLRMTYVMLCHLIKKFPDGHINVDAWPNIYSFDALICNLQDPFFLLLCQ